jgi:hypothetical protein
MRGGWYEFNNAIEASLLWDSAVLEISGRKSEEHWLEYAP